MSEHLTCPDCGAEVPPGSPRNLCPRCLLREALGSDPSAAAPSGGQSDETTDQVAHGSGVPKAENVLDRPPPELGQTVDSDPVEARHPDTGDYNPESANPLAGTTDYQPSVGSGAVIAGRYTLVEKIGEGGMGDVWVAKQTEPVKRKVALKLIKAGMDSKAVLQRFEQERQALAIMEHPNIARVIDGGMTAERRPFFVMELVNGLPLTRFCDEAQMGIRERLELFASICQAVQHAHQKGIIHRDLKPSNILVTIVDGKPVPKVIDFGVAKATAGKLTDESLSTQFGAVVGTLEYMSPEQAGFSGEDIDTRADIYSLGVILYELLTGLRPIDAKRLKKAALTEMLRIIKEEDPSKPSTRLSTDDSAPSMAALRHSEPKKLAALLRGELDWVVMKCLEKQRDRRYETANGLARDIQRYLSNEVVEARPPSAGYRVRKFVSRHRGQVLAAGLVLLALMAGVAGTTWGLIREAKANAGLSRANADLSRSRAAVQERYELAADAIKTFHTGVSEDFLLKQDQFKELRDRLLRSAQDFYGKLSALLRRETDPASRRALARSNFELAGLTGKVGSKKDALKAHRAVLAAREALAAEAGADAATTVDVGRSLTAVAGLLEATGQTGEAVATYRRSESLLTGPAGTDPAALPALASCRSQLGYILSRTGQTTEALATYQQAGADQEALAAAPGASAEARRDLADTTHRIGNLLSQTGRLTEAEAEYRRAQEIYGKLVADNPAAVTNLRNNLALSHNNLGNLLSQTGRPTEAEAEFRWAQEIYGKLTADNPAVTSFRDNLALSQSNLGVLLVRTGRPTEAEAEFRRALEIRKKLAADNPTVTEFRSRLAESHINLGLLLSRMGRPAEAEAEDHRALEIQEKLAADNPAVTHFRSRLADSHHNLGVLLSETGRAREAEAEFRRALEIYGKLAADNPAVTEFHSFLADSHNNLGLLLSRTGRAREAEAEFRRALEIYEKLAADNPKVPGNRDGEARTLNYLSVAQRRLGRLAEARQQCDRAVGLRETLVRENPRESDYRAGLAENLLNRGVALLAQGDRSAADLRRATGLYAAEPSLNGEHRFVFGSARAALAGLAGRDGSGVSAAEAVIEADAAMALLRGAVAMGFRNPDTFRTEDALDSLRSRDDFKLLMMDLAFPAEPFAR